MTIHQSTPHAVRDNRSDAVVGALVDRGLVAAVRRDEALAVVDHVLAGQSFAAAPLKRRFAELAGYLGGALVLSAAGIFFTAQWENLGAGEQVGLLAGITFLLAGAAFALGVTGAGFPAMRLGAEPVRRRLTGLLLTGAAASAGGAVGLLFDELVTGPDPTEVLLGFATLFILSAAGYLLAPTVIGQLGTALGLVMTVLLGLDEFGDLDGPKVGLSILAVGLVWLILAERGVWREAASARVIGVGLAVLGAQIPVIDVGEDPWIGYLATALVAAAAFAVYVARPAWPYLAAGVVAVTLVVPEALLDWTDNALGPAGGLLVAGVTLIVASLVGFRLRREVTETTGVPEQE